MDVSIDRDTVDIAILRKYALAWLTWEENNWDREAGMTKAEKELFAEVERLHAEIERLKKRQ